MQYIKVGIPRIGTQKIFPKQFSDVTRNSEFHNNGVNFYITKFKRSVLRFVL